MKNQRLIEAFTLIETLVAVSIITVAFTAILQASAQSFTYARFASNEATASFLAQEGLEFVHAVRDGNPRATWLNNLYYAVSPAVPPIFKVDPSVSSDFSNVPAMIALCNSGSGPCPAFKLDQTGVGYNYTTGSLTGFVREITISQVAGDEISVVSKVYWDNRTHSVSLRENLMNWHPQ